MKRTLFFPDLHLGSHDQAALRVALKIALREQPDEICILGDWIDGHDFNAHGFTDRRDKLQAGYMEEVGMCRAILDFLEEIPSVQRIIYVEGNHEFRVERFITNQGNKFLEAQGSAFLPKTLLKKDRAKRFSWVDYKTPGKAPFIEVAPGVIACHGLSTAKHAAHAHLVRVPGFSVVHGHTHRAQTFYSRCPVSDRTLYGHSPGTLAQLQPLWLSGASNWTQGVSILTQRGQRSALQHVPIDRGMAYFADEWVKAGNETMIEGVA